MKVFTVHKPQSKARVLDLVFIIYSLLYLSCSSNTSDQHSIMIENVNLISMESDQIQRDQCVVIKGRMIDQIGSRKDIKLSNNTRVIDGHGKYLMPGLCDMHIHIDHPDILKVNLAYGITTVMNFRGLPEHLILRELSRENEIFSPNIYTTGDYMEGYPATMPGFLSFDNPEDAIKAVKEQKQYGYDFIKVYRNLDSTMHKAICLEAAKNQMTVVGHLSPDITLEQSLKSGQKVIAHAEELMYFFNNVNDPGLIPDLVQLLEKYKVTFMPNLCIFKTLYHQVADLDSINSQNFLKYLQPALFQSWRKEYNYNHGRGIEWAEFVKERFSFLQLVTKKIKEAGIPVLASTDAPTSGAFPGLAVHQELKEFVELGFTPYEALRTATASPGHFISSHLENAENFGLIKKGFRADLLLLEKNPLENIENTLSIAGVVKNGRWYPQDSIGLVLVDLETVYHQVDPIVRSIEADVEDENLTRAISTFKQGKAVYPSQTLLGYYTMWYAGYQFLYENRSLTTLTDRAEKAVKFYKMYAEEYPDLHGSHYILGMAHKANRDTVQAIESFKHSLDLHPSNPYAKNQLMKLQ